MLFRKQTPSSHADSVADAASRQFERATSSTQRVADHALDTMSSTVHDLRQQVSPLIERAGEQANALAQRGIEAVRDRSHQLRDQAVRASDHTVGYIRHEPVKSVLIAAAAGAVLVALLSLLRRPS
ncbi:MAG TPA: hypothetical protein VI032_19100 [Burkholderiaceae bacterium]